MTVRRVVLDSMLARSATTEQLAALRSRGLKISTYIFALQEVWVDAHRHNVPGRYFGAIKKLWPHLDPDEPIVLGGGHLQELVAAPTREDRRRLAEVHRQRGIEVRQAHSKLLAGGASPESFDGVGREFNRDLDHAASVWIEMLERCRALDLRGEDFADDPVKRLSGLRVRLDPRVRPHAGERFDAMKACVAVWMLRAARKDPTKPRENDMEDIRLLDCLAVPAFVATDDTTLRRLVRASGSYQAPWVRSLDDLLTKPLPRGMPWGESARREHERWLRIPPRAPGLP